MARIKETMVMVCRKHWAVFILPIALAAICIIAALVGLASDGASGAGPAVALIVFGLVIALWAWIKHKGEYIAITETSLIGHRGIIRSKKLSTPLSKVQSIGLSNGLFGKLLGYHTITVANAATGSTEFIFTKMANAQAFVDAVNERI